MLQSSASLGLLHSVTFLRIYPITLKMLKKYKVFLFGKHNITFCTISSNEAVILYSVAKSIIKGNLSFRTKDKSSTEVKFRITFMSPMLFQ